MLLYCCREYYSLATLLTAIFVYDKLSSGMFVKAKTGLYVFLLAFFIFGSLIALSLKIKNPVLAQGSQPPKKILVKLKSSPQASSLLSVSDSLPQAQLLGGIPSTNFVVYKVDGDINQAIADVKTNTNIATAFEDKTVYLQKTTNDPYFTDQWALTSLKAAGTNSGWDQITDLANKTAQGKIAAGDMISCIWNTGNTNLDCVAGGVDNQGHGTHVAGIIGAVTDNQKGIAGVGWGVKLMSIKVLDANGSGSLSDALIGMYYAVDHGAKVLNLSLGSPAGGANGLTADEIAIIQEVVDYVIQSGAVIVAAAGNCGDSGSSGDEECGNLVNPIMYPAAANNVISVASLDKNNNLAPYSEHGNWVSVAAPGGSCSSESNKNDCILSTLATSINCSSLGLPGPASGYCYLQGTSMASPQVAGVAALLFAVKAGITNTQVKDIILQTANSGVAKGTNATIWGGVDALAAVLAVNTNLSPTNNPTPTTPAGATITPVLSLYPTTGIAKLPRIPPNPYPAPPYCPVTTGCSKKFQGDANCNGAVDLADLGIWFTQFDTFPPAIPVNNNANFFCAESNYLTYFVDLADFEAWRRNTTDLGYILPTNVPTPTVFYPSNTLVPPTSTISPPPDPTNPPANNTQPPPPASTATPASTAITPYPCPTYPQCNCNGVAGGCCFVDEFGGVTSVICNYSNGSCTDFPGYDDPWCGPTITKTNYCNSFGQLIEPTCAPSLQCSGGICVLP